MACACVYNVQCKKCTVRRIVAKKLEISGAAFASLLYVHCNWSPQRSLMLISEVLCTCSSHSLSHNTYTHDIHKRWHFYSPSFLFQAWPKQTIATAKTKHALSRQTRACAAHNGRSFAMPQICRICAFHDYVNFRFKTAANSVLTMLITFVMQV